MTLNVNDDQPVRSYRDLRVWPLILDLVEEVYRLTRLLPEDERFGMLPQMRRAAVSIPSNIAEGYGRATRKEYCRHVSIANGSLRELEAQLIVAGRLGLIEREQARTLWELIQQISRMLSGLMKSLRQKKD